VSIGTFIRRKLLGGGPTFGLREAAAISILGVVIAVAAALHYNS